MSPGWCHPVGQLWPAKWLVQLYGEWMADVLSDEEVTRLLPILATRARANERTSAAFRPPRTGIVEQVAERQPHPVHLDS